MKQSFGKTLMSYFLAVTLMASVIAGAISVSLNHAKAQSTGTTGVGYFDDLWDEIVEYGYLSEQSYSNFYDFVTPFIENMNYCVFVFHKENTDNWSISLFQSSNQQFNTFFRSGWGSGITANYNQGSLTLVGSFQQSNGSASYNTRILSQQAAFYETDTTTVFQNLNKVYPNLGIYNDSSIQFWCSHVIGTNSYWPDDRWSVVEPNLLPGSATPPTIDFEIITFNIGERTYLSVLDQRIMVRMDPDLMDYNLVVSGFYDNTWEDVSFDYSSVVLLPSGESYIPGNWSELSPAGIYAIDITSRSWTSIDSVVLSEIIDDEIVWVGAATNCPYTIVKSGEDGMSDSYTQAISNFYSYVNNYNTTHVIPDTLAETLFGVEGGKLYPVTVSEPSAVAATRNDGALVDGNLYTFQWAMTEPNNIGYNYELFDVVIIPSNYAGYYGLVYFYDGSLNPPYQFVDRVSFESLLNSFDCIIIIPDDAGTLEDNTWWQQLIDPVFRGDMAVGGTSSLGVEYVDTVAGNEFQGFMIVTKKAIQKQQLYVFNDGITKTYKLMSDYIEKQGDWDDSFLAWTASLFDQWQTLDGRLSSIYSLLFDLHLSDWMADISSKLDVIVSNTGEFEWNFWYMSLFSWVNQFKPDNSDFVAGLQQYDNNWEEFPELPAPSTVPLLPTIGG